MLPHRLTPSSRTLPNPFSRIFRSHNTLSSSFHSFFKVLLSFPSQYFFAIGFPVIFRLWWILSPIQSILPNKFTLFPEQFFSLGSAFTRLSLSLATLSRLFTPNFAVESSRSRLHHDTRAKIPKNPSVTEYRLYQLGLILFHSPLLKKSLLFSLPSLIDMLKLRESSYELQINRVDRPNRSGFSCPIPYQFTSLWLTPLGCHKLKIRFMILKLIYALRKEHTVMHSKLSISHCMGHAAYRNSLRSSSTRKPNYPEHYF